MSETPRDSEGAAARLDPSRLPVDALAVVLSRASGRAIDAEAIRADLEDGAPRNADGSINLVHYAAWLVREMDRGSD